MKRTMPNRNIRSEVQITMFFRLRMPTIEPTPAVHGEWLFRAITSGYECAS
ncbi:hypothetical protein ECAE60S_04525 [Eoetvoesiella caeni]